MKQFLKILLAAVCMAGVSAQAAQAQKRRVINAGGNYVTKEITGIGTFDEIMSLGIADVEYRQTQGGQARVAVYGADNVIGHLEVRNAGTALEVRMAKNIEVRGEHRLKVTVSGPRLRKASTMGTGDIDIRGTLETPELELSGHGTGDIGFDGIKCSDIRIIMRGTGDVEGRQLACRNLNIAVQGSGDVTLPAVDVSGMMDVSVAGSGDVETGGKAKNIVLKSRGLGGIDIRGIEAETVDVTVSGMGNIDAKGTAGEAVLKVYGSGSIEAYGLRALVVDATVSGSGSIHCHAVNALRASASDVGRIVYGGDPKQVDIRGKNTAVKRR